MKMELESDPLDKLSPLHRAFCYAYVENGGNGTRAYMLVYPKCSYNAASVRAYDLLRTDKIIAGIKQIYSKIWKDRETDIEKGKTYNQIHALALADISEVIDLKGGTLSVKTLDDIPEHARKAIQSIEYIRKNTKDGVDENIKVKMYSKLEALKVRAQIQNMMKTEDETKTIEIVIKPAARETEE
jgi:hypothetical protein